MQRAASRAGIDATAERLIDAVSIRSGSSGAVIVISALAKSAASAAALANAIAVELQAQSQSGGSTGTDLADAIAEDTRAVTGEIDRIAAEVASLRDANDPADADRRLSELEDRLTTLRVERASLVSLSADVGSNAIGVIEPAEVPVAPETPKPLSYAVLGAVAGLVVASLVVLVVAEVRGWPRTGA